MILFKTKYSGLVPGTVRGKALLRKLVKTMYKELLRFHHKFNWPKHFTAAGAREYGYRPRSGQPGSPGGRFGFKRSYTGRKLKTKGHTRPLVWSGLSEKLSRLRDIRGTRTGAKLVCHARGLNLVPGGPDEMTRVSTKEKIQLVRIGERWLGRKIKAAHLS